MSLGYHPARRHYIEHPLAKLTDDELDALRQLARLRPLLRDDLGEVLDGLADLVTYEEGERA